MEKWMGWSEGQIELFDILGRVCTGVGGAEASGIVESIKHADRNGTSGKMFVEQLAELRERAARVESLEKEMVSLKEELSRARRKLDERARPSVSSKATFFKSPREHTTSMPPRSVSESAVFRSSSGYSEPPSEAYKALTMKHNALVTNHKEIVVARKQLEDQLRAKKASVKDWVKYANGLEKKVQRLEKLRLLDTNSESQSLVLTTLNPPQLITSNSPVNLTQGSLAGIINGSLLKSIYALSNISNTTESISWGNPGAPELSSKPSHIRHMEGQGGEQLGVQSPVSMGPPKDGHSRKLRRGNESSTVLPKLVTKDPKSVPKEQDHRQLLRSHSSSSTEEGPLADPSLMDNCRHSTLPPVDEADSISDVPIVISARAVRKRKAHGSPRDSTKVKLEVLTSSPINIAGLVSMQACESLDLDDIGEKHPTPKKSRQTLSTPTTHTQQDHNRKRPMGSLSALQPVSPNKQILPRTSGKEHQPKRRRLEERLIGTKILADDGEDEIVKEETNLEPLMKLPADSGAPEQRLGVLLDNPSAKSRVLTPTRQLFASNAVPSHNTGEGLQKRHPLLPAPAAYRGSSTTNSTPLRKLQNATASDRQTGTSRKRGTESFKDNLNLDGNNNGNERFRARPVRHLGLEHFKVNPSFNQGYDYAFADVVRGREQRSCLPGCTKPECCGYKLRKFVELTRKALVNQTRSQEEEDDRILKDYMGDNHSKLRTMNKSEKEELLVQARTRELAQKAGKHRHAYERRRSPPGFWRTDFPTTQEMETDRAEAAKVERELVQQRYEEAMRPGGRWMFRDE